MIVKTATSVGGEIGGCRIVAHGVARAAFDDVAPLRKAPGPPGSPRVSPALLKHADEQTVLGLAAVLRAMTDFGLADRSFAAWGVLAAPRYLGRVQGAAHVDRYRRQGASTVSPLIIPHLSLHSMSGTISLALGVQGTNYGLGGAPGHLGEGLLAALAARDDGLPGLWLVATAWDPEPIPDLERRSAIPTTGFAAALALMPEAAEGFASLGTLRYVPAATAGDAVGPALELPDLARFLSDPTLPNRPRRWYHPLSGGAIELTLAAAEANSVLEIKAG